MRHHNRIIFCLSITSVPEKIQKSLSISIAYLSIAEGAMGIVLGFHYRWEVPCDEVMHVRYKHVAPYSTSYHYTIPKPPWRGIWNVFSGWTSWIVKQKHNPCADNVPPTQLPIMYPTPSIVTSQSISWHSKIPQTGFLTEVSWLNSWVSTTRLLQKDSLSSSWKFNSLWKSRELMLFQTRQYLVLFYYHHCDESYYLVQSVSPQLTFFGTIVIIFQGRGSSSVFEVVRTRGCGQLLLLLPFMLVQSCTLTFQTARAQSPPCRLV